MNISKQIIHLFKMIILSIYIFINIINEMKLEWNAIEYYNNTEIGIY